MKILIQLKLFIYIIFAAILIYGCKKSESNSQENIPSNSKITIAAAANLRDVLEDLKQVYINENSDKEIETTFGSSGLLVQQILNGAPFDLFLSADTSFPEKLRAENRVSGNPKIYAYGKVVLWSSKFDVSEGLNIVSKSEIKKIAIANPQLAPYGKNAVEALRKTGLYSKIESKIVWAENINQATQFVSTGNADIGFIALSNAKNKEMVAKGNYYELSEKECAPISQSGVVLKGENRIEAQHFFEFLRSGKAIQVWKKYGYQSENTR